jgi:uncharacterized protein YcbK (DUF882 family)
VTRRKVSGFTFRPGGRGCAPVLIAGLLCAGIVAAVPFAARAKTTERTISLYNVHTKERLTVTFKRNGVYNPEALVKINHLMRDWRADRKIRMDPGLIDLIWELHKELGSKKPVHLISGFRSLATNNMLRRRGRGAAKRSMHIQGKAADVFFPDVPVKRLREAALVHQHGGVGYYPRAHTRGFVHIDTGSVRHWPRMSPTLLARLIENHKRTKPGSTKPHNAKPARSGPMVLAGFEKRPALKVRPARAPSKPTVVAALAPVPKPRLKPNFTPAIERVAMAPRPKAKPKATVLASFAPSVSVPFLRRLRPGDTAATRQPVANGATPPLPSAQSGGTQLKGGTVVASRGVTVNRSRKGNLLMSVHVWSAPRAKVQASTPMRLRAVGPKISSL